MDLDEILREIAHEHFHFLAVNDSLQMKEIVFLSIRVNSSNMYLHCCCNCSVYQNFPNAREFLIFHDHKWRIICV